MTKSVLPEIEKKIGMAFAEWIKKEHWEKERTLVDISKELGFPRITLMRHMKRLGIPTRSTSADSQRRYKNMTIDQKKQQTAKANDSVRKNGIPKLRGRRSWSYGLKKETDERIKKISTSKLGDKNPIKKEENRVKASKGIIKYLKDMKLPQETIVCDLLDKNGIKYKYQFQIGRYVCDFAFPERNLIIEIDSLDKWGKEKREGSRIRDEYLNDRGWEVVHVGRKQVYKNPESILSYL
jgi:very-short-patch-repair endonuclease